MGSFDVIKVEKNHIQEHGIKNCDHFQEISPFLTAITKDHGTEFCKS